MREKGAIFIFIMVCPLNSLFMTHVYNSDKHNSEKQQISEDNPHSWKQKQASPPAGRACLCRPALPPGRTQGGCP